MDSRSFVFTASPDLIRRAAKQQSWKAVMRQMGLQANDENVLAFRARAHHLGVDVSHLRWCRPIAELSKEELQAAAAGARSRRDILQRLGRGVRKENYDALESISQVHGIELPELRRHVVYRTTDDEVRLAFSSAQSMADLLRRVGLVARGDNYRVMKGRLIRLGLDPAALPGFAWSKGRAFVRMPLQDMLVRGKHVPGPTLIQRLLEAGIFERVCEACDLPEWLGQPIPLEIDHINGDHDDNQLENLRLLCPNCHAQTDTYRGRNIRRRRTLSDVRPE